MAPTLIDINLLKENPDNPRTITDAKFAQLIESVKNFPQMLEVRPIAFKSGFVVLGGNMRLRACKAAGLKQVPAVDCSDMTEAQQREFVIKDNVGYGAWDWEAIQADWPEAEEWGLDIPDAFKVVPEAAEDDYEMPDEIQTDIVLGDLFEIGEHRLLCGDSTDSDAVARLMNGKKADMVFTDPPYNVNYESDHSGKIKNDNMNEGDFEDFVRGIYSNLYLFTSDNSAIYICHATMVLAFDTVLREFDWRISNKIIWVKDIPTYSMAQYKWQYEPIHFVVKGQPKFYGDKTQTNIWEVKAIQSAGSHDDAGNSWFKGGAKGLTLHPTQKPIGVPSKAITNSSAEGNIILDLFGGSGSTMVASEQLKRKCYSMELDPKFMAVILKRMKKLDESLVIKCVNRNLDIEKELSNG
jgi:DNA modification methylase